MHTSTMVQAYLDCVAWLLDEEIDPDAQFSDQAYEHAREACAEFMAIVGEVEDSAYIGASGYDCEAMLGHDLWLTRNGHGCGFWESDRWSDEYRDQLDSAAGSMVGVGHIKETTA